ncbi:MAG: VOC family protein [Terracidiphilus sp.]
MLESRSAVIPSLRYADAPAAIDWLCQVLGFIRHAVYANPDGTIAHAELALGGGMIMLGSTKEDEHGRRFKSPHELGDIETRSAYIVVPNADAVHARAVDAGAQIIRALQDSPYGSREFALRDPEGHSWTVGTYDPWASHE